MPNRSYKGVIPSPEDKRDWRIDRCMDMPVGSASFPKTYSVPWLPEVKDQEQTNSCTAFVLALIFECIYKLIYGDMSGFSTGYLYGNRIETEYKDEGEIMRDAVKGACIHGNVKSCLWDNNFEVPKAIEVFEAAYPKLKDFSKKLIKGYVRIRGEDEAKAHLMKYGIPLFASAQIRHVNPLSKSKDYHALAITGWLRNGDFKCRNSWGKYDCANPEIEYENFNEIWGVIPNMDKIKFTDVADGMWYTEAIYNQVEKGTLQGFPDGTFCPDAPITRGQAAVILERLDRLNEAKFEKNL